MVQRRATFRFSLIPCGDRLKPFFLFSETRQKCGCALGPKWRESEEETGQQRMMKGEEYGLKCCVDGLNKKNKEESATASDDVCLSKLKLLGLIITDSHDSKPAQIFGCF